MQTEKTQQRNPPIPLPAENLTKRYYVHDFLIGDPILLDTRAKTYSIYGANIYGQVYNLENPKKATVSSGQIQKLIHKLNSVPHSLCPGLVIDRYIYTYFLTDDERAQCRRTAKLWNMDTLIIKTDSLHEAVKGMCEWVYENRDYRPAEDRMQGRERLMRYCENYLERIATQ